MKILVIGGTGRIGSKVVDRLRAAGHDIVIAAPSTGIDIERAPMDQLAQRFLDRTQDPRRVVGDAQAPYFGAQLQDDTLVPVGQAWLGRQGFDSWLQQSGLVHAN